MKSLLISRSHPMRWMVPVFFCAASVIQAAELSNRYEGDVPMTESTPVWQESRKGGGGKAVVSGGKLKVEVSPGANHFYVIGKAGESERGAGLDAYDGSTVEGTTIDFCVSVQADSPEEEAFGIQVGTGVGSASIIFRTNSILVGKRVIERDNTQPGTFRIAFRDGRLSLYSADGGELVNNYSIPSRYPVNVISLGTRASLQFSAPVAWELNFIRWSNGGATFSAPNP